MKHVIVIETADRPKPLGMSMFEKDVIGVVEELAELYAGVAVVHSAFFVDSAIAAIHEMYNAPKWEG